MVKKNIEIKEFTSLGYSDYFKMSEKFYSSGASITKFNEDIIKNNFNEIISNSEFLKGFFIIVDDKYAGFFILSFMWSSEVGGKTAFIEEIFIDEQFRNLGIGSFVLDFIIKNYAADVVRLRLEVCNSNKGASKLYKKFGFEYLKYDQMILENKNH